MYKLVFVRHGESEFNKKNIFAGFVNSDLSPKGEEESRRAGQVLKKKGFAFDCAFTSVLERNIKTLNIILDEMDLMWIPVTKHWALNERHYGDLEGRSKKLMAKKFGEEQVFQWRRGYRVRPPEITPKNKYYKIENLYYKPIIEVMNKKKLPLAESLYDVYQRTVPYWKEQIAPAIKKGKNVLIVSHGNSIRSIIKYLDKISDDKISALDIPTGIPLVYELNRRLKPIRHYYLASEKDVKAAINKVKNQGKIDKKKKKK
jgi:2,3-bisphosphoglycerate-dependent phosphoglycerate mutase